MSQRIPSSSIGLTAPAPGAEKASRPASSPGTSTPAALEEASRQPRILLVEDNRDILLSTQRILTAQKYEVHTAADGEEALIKASEVLPDIVLLDVMIPKIDGLEVCRRLKTDPRTRSIMVMHVTGRGSIDNRIQGFDAGADDYIPKPFHVPELLARIRSAWRLKRLTDDLAERNRQLVQSQKDLIQAEKMATIGLLASGIAHEFNNIMAGISGYAQLAKKDPRYRDTLVEIALTQTERALELTRSLSTYNRKPDSAYTESAAQVIESALCLVVKELERTNVRIVKEFRGDVRVAISPGQLQEVILNLVLNAIQAIERPDGQIRVRLEPLDASRSAAIEVIDNGTGIPEENIGRIFDPFFTTRGALGGGRQSGTGLGLTVCYNIIRSCEGRIEVTSAPGKGTTFRVTLPIVEGTEAGSGSERGGASAAGLNGRLRVLVVDDESAIRDIVRNFLVGHEVVGCATGEEAVEAHSRAPFDYVILDVCIQNSMNGFQVFERLMSSPRPPRVIFASGRFPDAVYKPYLERAHAHLLKPFQLESLAALLGIAAHDPNASKVADGPRQLTIA